MRRALVPVVAALMALPVLLGACAKVEPAIHEPYPAVEIADGADESAPKTLTLTADAVRRLELTTVVVADTAAIPFSAVLYDKKGAPWVYASTRDRTFLRIPIKIRRIEKDTALLTKGPGVGTRIVTRSAIKLYGAETGVGGGH